MLPFASIGTASLQMLRGNVTITCYQISPNGWFGAFLPVFLHNRGSLGSMGCLLWPVDAI